MSENRLPKLIERIRDKTVSRELKWEATANEDKFQCAFTNFVVTLSSRLNRNNRGDLDYVFSILDEDGAVVDKIDDEELSEILIENYGQVSNSGYALLGSIHDAARRIARGTDDAIESLLNELEDY